MNEIELSEYRIKRLQAAIDKLDAGNKSAFGRRLEFKDGAFIRQLLAGTRPITEKTIRQVESLHGMNGWFNLPGESVKSVAPTPPSWPFSSIAEDQVRALAPGDLKALEGALALAIAQLRLKVDTKPAALPTEVPGQPRLDDVEDPFFSDPHGLASAPATSYSDYLGLPSRNPKLATSLTVSVNVAAGEPHAANDKFDKVPELGDVLLAAGEGIENDHELETGFVQFRRSFLQSVGASAKKARVVYAKGDSMEPVIQDGAALLVVPSDDLKINELTAGGVYAINYDGKMIVKTIVRDRLTGKCAARSFNSQHPDIPLEDGKPVRILGKIVWAGCPLRDQYAGHWIRR